MTKHFGPYGGRYIPEMLVPALTKLKQAYELAKREPKFKRELQDLLHTYSGRPTPLTYAENLTKQLKGAQIFLKREDLNHTGAHKITHCLGQGLLARRLGKKRLIAETGAGQHGLATATTAAKLGMQCTVYMGEKDVNRQRPNVFFMERLGAKVIPVKFGQQTLKDAVNAALKDYMANSKSAHYVLGSVLGPDPYPEMNRNFQSIVGREVKSQLRKIGKYPPNVLIASVGGGSNAMGIFYTFLKNSNVHLIGAEAGGIGKKQGEHAARFVNGRVGVMEGYKSYFLQTNDGNIANTHSIAAGLDYPGIGPELAYLHDKKRINFITVSDKLAITAFDMLADTEGILPALESAHAVAAAIKLAPKMSKSSTMVVNISGRADKDLFSLARIYQDMRFKQFLLEEANQ